MSPALSRWSAPADKAVLRALTDSYNRRISYLRISVTDRCNLRCVYCMPPQGIPLMDHGAILSYEEMLRIARVAAGTGITKIRVTGGEPLVRKGIADFVSTLREIPGITDIAMTTNGILLEAAAGALRKAGMQRINISLDTLDPHTYRRITRGGDIAAVMAGIHAARVEGFAPIKVNVVVMRGINDSEIVSFARLTLERPVHIRFIEYMPVNGLNVWKKDCFIANDEIMRAIQTIGPLLPADSDNGAGPARMYQLQGAQGKLGFISPLSNHFCDQCNRLRLTADGKLRTCLFSDTETDLRSVLRAGCSDADLLRLMRAAIAAKPLRHAACDQSFKKCSRGMSAIGG